MNISIDYPLSLECAGCTSLALVKLPLLRRSTSYSPETMCGRHGRTLAPRAVNPQLIKLFPPPTRIATSVSSSSSAFYSLPGLFTCREEPLLLTPILPRIFVTVPRQLCDGVLAAAAAAASFGPSTSASSPPPSRPASPSNRRNGPNLNVKRPRSPATEDGDQDGDGKDGAAAPSAGSYGLNLPANARPQAPTGTNRSGGTSDNATSGAPSRKKARAPTRAAAPQARRMMARAQRPTASCNQIKNKNKDIPRRPAPASGSEPTRSHVRNEIEKVLVEIFVASPELGPAQATEFARLMEEAMWQRFVAEGTTTTKQLALQHYKMQFTEVRRSLRDHKHGSLRTRIVAHDAVPAELAVLSAAELANDSMRAVADERKQQFVQGSILAPLDMGAVRIKKTQEGEEAIEIDPGVIGIGRPETPPQPTTQPTHTLATPPRAHSAGPEANVTHGVDRVYEMGNAHERSEPSPDTPLSTPSLAALLPLESALDEAMEDLKPAVFGPSFTPEFGQAVPLLDGPHPTRLGSHASYGQDTVASGHQHQGRRSFVHDCR